MDFLEGTRIFSAKTENVGRGSVLHREDAFALPMARGKEVTFRRRVETDEERRVRESHYEDNFADTIRKARKELSNVEFERDWTELKVAGIEIAQKPLMFFTSLSAAFALVELVYPLISSAPLLEIAIPLLLVTTTTPLTFLAAGLGLLVLGAWYMKKRLEKRYRALSVEADRLNDELEKLVSPH